MCNLNILYRKKGKSNITGFLMASSSHSYIGNSHGEGIYLSSIDEAHKSKSKIDYNKFIDSIEQSDVIITHQRWSTSGFDVKFNHPFHNENFVMVHNGIINQFLSTDVQKKKGSDTYGFWLKFNEEFNKLRKKDTRQDRIVKVLKRLFLDDDGSYSILIYDKKTKISYYFKNYPQIHFYTNEDYLFITTEDDNKEFLSLISSKEFIELEINRRIIYQIKSDGEVFILAQLPEKKSEIIVNNEQKDWNDDNVENEFIEITENETPFIDDEIHDRDYYQGTGW